MGVVVNIRKAFYRIGLWTRSAGKPPQGGAKAASGPQRSAEESRAILMKIGGRFKAFLAIKDNELVEFMGHSDSANAGSSRAKAKFSV